MEDVKRGRGRPKGSGEDDTGALMAVARLLVDNPKLKRTTAMKAVLRTRHDCKAASDSALIRRWQVKWAAADGAYTRRVREERVAAETERQRRERAAAEAREMSRKPMWEIAAELRAAGQLPHWSFGGTAHDLFAQHREAMKGLSGWQAEFDRYRQMGEMMKGQLGISKAIEEMRRNTTEVSDALRAAMGTLNHPGFSEAMRKTGITGLTGHANALDNLGLGKTMRRMDEVGRTLAESYSLAHLGKLPTGF